MPDTLSLKDRVQARHEKLQKDRNVTLDVPGYEGVLKARYRRLTLKEINTIAARVAKLKGLDDTTRELYIYADSLVIAGEAVYDAELDKDRKEDDPLPQGKRWSAALAHENGFPAPTTARQAVFAIIAYDTQVWSQYQTLMAWQDGDFTADEQLVGESEPPPQSS